MFIPERKPITRDLSKEKISVLIYGSAMVGKTKMALSFPNPLVFNGDGNMQDATTEYIDLRNSYEVTAQNGTKGLTSKWNLIKFYELSFKNPKFIEELKKKGYETIVFDTLDHMYDWCREYHLKKHQIESEEQDPRSYNPIYGEIKKDFKSVIVSLIESIKSDFNLVLTSFEGQKELKDGLETFLQKNPTIKLKTEKSGNSHDKIGVYEAIFTRINMVGGIFIQEKPNTENEQETIKIRYFLPLETKYSIGGNRLGIKGPIYPNYQTIINKIKGEKNDK